MNNKKILALVISVICVINSLYSQTYTVVLQPDSRGYDAILSSANGGVNYGTSNRIRASRNTSGQYERTLIKFDANTILQNPMKLTTPVRFKLTTLDRSKLTTPNRVKLTT